MNRNSRALRTTNPPKRSSRLWMSPARNARRHPLPKGQAGPQTQSAKAAQDDDDSLFGGLDLFGDDLTEEPVTISASAPLREKAHLQRHRDWSGLAKWGGCPCWHWWY